jgi:hypothetical protein
MAQQLGRGGGVYYMPPMEYIEALHDCLDMQAVNQMLLHADYKICLTIVVAISKYLVQTSQCQCS